MSDRHWLVVTLGIGSLLLCSCAPDLVGECADIVRHEEVSPARDYVATVFERDCGATTDFSTQVVIRAAAQRFDSSKAMPIFVAKGRPEITLVWGAKDALTISPQGMVEEPFTKLERWQDIKITYKPD